MHIALRGIHCSNMRDNRRHLRWNLYTDDEHKPTSCVNQADGNRSADASSRATQTPICAENREELSAHCAQTERAPVEAFHWKRIKPSEWCTNVCPDDFVRSCRSSDARLCTQTRCKNSSHGFFYFSLEEQSVSTGEQKMYYLLLIFLPAALAVLRSCFRLFPSLFRSVRSISLFKY